MKYFDLYFSYGSNAFLAISKDVKTFIEVINLLPSNDIDKFMKLKINGLFFYEHSEWFEKLQVLFDGFSTTAKENVIMALYNHLDLIDDTPAFLTLHARDRACVIIAKYLCGSSKQYAIKFSSNSNVNYRNIVFMNRIISLTEHIIDDIDTSIKQENIEILNNTLKSMCEEIICQKINIYDTEYYFQNNIWCLKQNTDEHTFNEYMSWILSDANLYRVIADALGCSISNQYKQYISKESFDSLLLDSEKVENFFSQNPPQSDSERYIVDLYNSYMNSTSQENNGIISPNFVKLDL